MLDDLPPLPIQSVYEGWWTKGDGQPPISFGTFASNGEMTDFMNPISQLLVPENVGSIFVTVESAVNKGNAPSENVILTADPVYVDGDRVLSIQDKDIRLDLALTRPARIGGFRVKHFSNFVNLIALTEG